MEIGDRGKCDPETESVLCKFTYLHETFFFGWPVFRFTICICNTILNQTTLDLRKKKWGFLNRDLPVVIHYCIYYPFYWIRPWIRENVCTNLVWERKMSLWGEVSERCSKRLIDSDLYGCPNTRPFLRIFCSTCPRGYRSMFPEKLKLWTK